MNRLHEKISYPAVIGLAVTLGLTACSPPSEPAVETTTEVETAALGERCGDLDTLLQLGKPTAHSIGAISTQGCAEILHPVTYGNIGTLNTVQPFNACDAGITPYMLAVNTFYEGEPVQGLVTPTPALLETLPPIPPCHEEESGRELTVQPVQYL